MRIFTVYIWGAQSTLFLLGVQVEGFETWRRMDSFASLLFLFFPRGVGPDSIPETHNPPQDSSPPVLTELHVKGKGRLLAPLRKSSNCMGPLMICLLWGSPGV